MKLLMCKKKKLTPAPKRLFFFSDQVIDYHCKFSSHRVEYASGIIEFSSNIKHAVASTCV